MCVLNFVYFQLNIKFYVACVFIYCLFLGRADHFCVCVQLSYEANCRMIPVLFPVNVTNGQKYDILVMSELVSKLISMSNKQIKLRHTCTETRNDQMIVSFELNSSNGKK